MWHFLIRSVMSIEIKMVIVFGGERTVTWWHFVIITLWSHKIIKIHDASPLYILLNLHVLLHNLLILGPETIHEINLLGLIISIIVVCLVLHENRIGKMMMRMIINPIVLRFWRIFLYYLAAKQGVQVTITLGWLFVYVVIHLWIAWCLLSFSFCMFIYGIIIYYYYIDQKSKNCSD